MFADAAAMLDAVRPDALDICAPPDAHAALCELAAARGIATSCQKPLAPTLEEARRIVEAAVGRVRLMVHENWRFRAPYRQTMAWLRGGAIGGIRAYRLRAASAGLLRDVNGCLPALLRQPLLARLPRLTIGELLIHHLDVTRWLLGELEVVAARTTHACADVAGEDSAVIDLRTADGTAIEVEGSFSDAAAGLAVRDELRIDGALGSITFDGTSLCMVGQRRDARTYDPHTVYADSYAATIAHFASAVAGNTEFETSGEDNLNTLLLVEEAYRHAGTH